MKYLVAWPRHGLGDRLKLTASAWAAADALHRVFVIRWLPPVGCEAHWEDLFKPTTGWIIEFVLDIFAEDGTLSQSYIHIYYN